ncbi:MAG: serine hydrolase [Candidatus Marinimicrobia bacterium]|nr:serine hydrolase [Candidatus Neomarinimicrobiota bacterium]
MIKKILFASVIFSILVLGQSSLETQLQSIKKKYNLVGMSVVVVNDTSIIFAEGFGKRDVARDLPMEAGTQYRIASISKMISATALMKLYDEGKFQLDDDISDYLGYSFRNPKYPNQKITFRRLMSHTSSIRDGAKYSTFLSAGYSQSNPPSIRELFLPGGSYYNADIWSSKSPDSHYFQYANANFGVVASLVEILSGKRFDQYCREELFQPLGMKSDFNVAQLEDIDNLAALYRKNGINWVSQADEYKGVKPAERDLSDYTLGDNGFIFGPQGGLRASALDLANFLVLHKNNGQFRGQQILSDSTMQRMHETVWQKNGDNGNNYYGIFNAYALGNSTTENLLEGIPMIGHPGEAYGLISDLYYSKDEGFGIVFLTNGGEWGNGAYSGWYNVEEEVYNACYHDLTNPTNIYQNEKQPVEFKITKIYPNPFNPDTVISFYIHTPSKVRLEIYNLEGKLVKTIKNNYSETGYHSVKFDAAGLASGIYFCHLVTKDFVDSKRIVLLK